jgi:hypothetical protein
MNVNLFKNLETVYAPRKEKISEIIGGLFIGGMGIMLLILFFLRIDQKNSAQIIMVLILGGGTALAGLYIVSNQFVKRFEFYMDKLIAYNLFRTKTILYSEIEGIRKRKEGKADRIYIYVKNSTMQAVTIEPGFFAEKKEIYEWVKNSFTDLTEAELKKDEEEIEANEEYGNTAEERKSAVKKAKIIVRIINIIAVIISFGSLFWYEPLWPALWILILIPIAALTMIKFSKGLIREDGSSSSKYPDLSPAILFPSIMLSMRGIRDWNIAQLSSLWVPFILFTMLLFFYVCLCSPRVLKSRFAIFSILFFCLAYGFGTTMALNGIYINPEKTYYASPLIGKNMTKERNPKYSLTIAPWELKNSECTLNVNKETYDNYKPGDKVKIRVKRGLFNISVYNYE